MDKPIQMAIGVGLAIAAMAIVGVYVFGVIGGSTVSTDIVPKTLDAISSNQGKSLQLSAALTNQGSGSIQNVAAVLRVDVKQVCEAGTGSTDATNKPSQCGVGQYDSDDTGVIYFPISYSDTVVDSFSTINIRGSIETEGSGTGAINNANLGCKLPIPTSAAGGPIDGVAGFSSLDKAIEYLSVKDGKITTAKTGLGAGTITIAPGDVLCARDLGIFAGEEITLTVIAETTSGDTIERIIPLTVR